MQINPDIYFFDTYALLEGMDTIKKLIEEGKQVVITNEILNHLFYIYHKYNSLKALEVFEILNSGFIDSFDYQYLYVNYFDMFQKSDNDYFDDCIFYNLQLLNNYIYPDRIIFVTNNFEKIDYINTIIGDGMLMYVDEETKQLKYYYNKKGESNRK